MDYQAAMLPRAALGKKTSMAAMKETASPALLINSVPTEIIIHIILAIYLISLCFHYHLENKKNEEPSSLGCYED